MTLLEIIMAIGLALLGGYLVRLRQKIKNGVSQPELGERECGVCGKKLPKNAVRTHLGKWRCAEHKNVG